MPLPKPKDGEKQSEFVSRCISFVKNEDSSTPNDQASAMCYSQWRNKEMNNQIKLNYNIPITIVENPVTGETGQSDFIIQGIAINSIITDNKHKFVGEELEEAAHTLNSVPLLKDHSNSVDSIVGRVIYSEYNKEDKNVLFKAKVNDTEAGKHIKQLIKSGDLNTVSIGADVESMDEEKGVFVLRGIKFRELSLVAIPADNDARFTFRGNSFETALQEAYKTIEQKVECKICGKMIEKDKMEEHMTMHKDKMDSQSNQSNSTELTEDANLVNDNNINKKEIIMEEDKNQLDSLKSDFSTLSDQFKSQSEVLTKVLEELKTLKEKPIEVKVEKVGQKEEPKVEEVKKKEKVKKEEEEEDEEEVDEKSGYKIIREHRSFTVVRNKYR